MRSASKQDAVFRVQMKAVHDYGSLLKYAEKAEDPRPRLQLANDIPQQLPEGESYHGVSCSKTWKPSACS